MKAFNCLLVIASLTLCEAVQAGPPEYFEQESATSTWRFHLAPTDSGAYSIIVFGAQEPRQRDSPFILAIHEMTSDSVESAVRYGKSAKHNALTETEKIDPLIDEYATPWWAMLLTAIGLVFYQIRRPVRPRIGTR